MMEPPARFIVPVETAPPTPVALLSVITPPLASATFRDGIALILGAPEYVLGDACPADLRARIEALEAEAAEKDIRIDRG